MLSFSESEELKKQETENNTLWFACRNAIKDDDVILTGWEQDILDIAKKIIQEQSPRQ